MAFKKSLTSVCLQDLCGERGKFKKTVHDYHRLQLTVYQNIQTFETIFYCHIFFCILNKGGSRFRIAINLVPLSKNRRVRSDKQSHNNL